MGYTYGMGTSTGKQKAVIYQVFPRLFGNTSSVNKEWGTLQENGVGKFNDFTNRALTAIHNLGISHIWYTGVLQHMTLTDYSSIGIPADPPEIVKGRAGSPFAIKDYYNVDPDLAEKPEQRLEEFEALINRTHKHDMKVIIDIVPNHVARTYHSATKPDGVTDFGQFDDNSIEYRRDNNFYYITNKSFKIPIWRDGYRPLFVLSHDEYIEKPAKWTGNIPYVNQPDQDDWYDTVKINFGVRPDGTNDFDALPAGFEAKDYQYHYQFWQDKIVPDSWIKFRDIVLYWLDKGVDGFRYDMAEMVPVEFWSYLNSTIKMSKPDALLLAEIYKPDLYRDFIFKGKMDYLYDKEDFYDTMKCIIQGNATTDCIHPALERLTDIEHHMLHFLENHDEQRIASTEFANNADAAKPAIVVACCISSSPTMIYFGQEVGESAEGNAGFGSNSRTTIYDYWGVPVHQRWMNGGRFDGGNLSPEEVTLRQFYRKLLTLSINSSALKGDYQEIHRFNRYYSEFYNDRLFSFVRWSDDECLIIAANFSPFEEYGFDLKLPEELLNTWKLGDGVYTFHDILNANNPYTLSVSGNISAMRVDLAPLESMILQKQ